MSHPGKPSCPRCHGEGLIEEHYFDAKSGCEVFDYITCPCTKTHIPEEDPYDELPSPNLPTPTEKD